MSRLFMSFCSSRPLSAGGLSGLLLLDQTSEATDDGDGMQTDKLRPFEGDCSLGSVWRDAEEEEVVQTMACVPPSEFEKPVPHGSLSAERDEVGRECVW